jgi:hypothetical protein
LRSAAHIEDELPASAGGAVRHHEHAHHRDRAEDARNRNHETIGANIWQIVWVLLSQRMVVGLFGTKWCRTTSEHLHRRVHYLLVRRADPRVLRGATRSVKALRFE